VGTYQFGKKTTTFKGCMRPLKYEIQNCTSMNELRKGQVIGVSHTKCREFNYAVASPFIHMDTVIPYASGRETQLLVGTST